MKLSLYNTETRALEEVFPHDGQTIKLYTCGPTVYNFPHIGNLRTFVVEDFLKRVMRFFDMNVCHVMNLTDVDDKTIRGAIQKNVTLDEYTAVYTKAFFEDLHTLGIDPADHYPEATKYIPQMIDLIDTLMQKGIAYVGADGSVYFAINKFASYGKLSHLQEKTLQTGEAARINADEYGKEHVADFVLWKKYDPERDGTIFWESPYGKGRPGWHIECSVMAKALLGDTIDIHAGGVDLIFPHHENEIAQSEAATGKPFVRQWVHVEHLLVEGRKMSKSLGNFYTLRDLIKKKYNPRAIRLMLLSTHYRMCLNFTFEALEAAHHTLKRIDECILRCKKAAVCAGEAKAADFIAKMEKEFKTVLSIDLNISEAMAILFEVVRNVNSAIDEKRLTEADKKAFLAFFAHVDSILNVMQFEDEVVIPLEILALAEAREVARKMKDFVEADKLRKAVSEAGYLIEDTPQGPVVRSIGVRL